MKRVVGLGTNLTSSIYLSSPTLSRVCYDFKKMSFVHDRYSDLIGINIYQNRPPLPPQSAQTKILDRFHPSTEILPEYWQRTDVWYFHFSLSLSLSCYFHLFNCHLSMFFGRWDYDRNPRGKVHVLATVNERTYNGGKMGADHPISWCQLYDGGRVWYRSVIVQKQNASSEMNVE
jgi:hypothetical protein